jgi:hypothetical protein
MGRGWWAECTSASYSKVHVFEIVRRDRLIWQAFHADYFSN